jgi:RNA polymerase sigma-70 factor (ECF subfamily)
VVQTTVCKAIANLGTYRGEAALLTWLGSICRNEIASHYRRKIRSAEEVELDEEAVGSSSVRGGPAPPGPEDELLRLEVRELIHLVLDVLPSHYGKALEWKYIDGLPVKEIAVRLEVGPKAAESLLTRARRSFRDHYDELTRSSIRVDARSSEDWPRKVSRS